MDVWEFNPEGLGCLWLKAIANSGGEIILAESLHAWGRRDVPLFNYNMGFALELRKRAPNLSQSSQWCKHCVTPTWLTKLVP